MRKLLSLHIALLFLVITGQVHAQNRCGSMEHLHQQLQQNPQMQQVRQLIEQQAQQYAQQGATGSRAVITIPVVVHVVYNTGTQNVSDQQIQSQIDRLNLDFRKLNTDWTNTPSVWQSIVADYEIEFCLATRDPQGNSTTGIVRRQTSTTSFSTNDNVKRTANGGSDAWPASSYLNIWVCRLGGGTLGYAQFPGGSAATDGVVINYTCFGSIGTATAPFNLGRTATHEVGHWLNLYHIWGDDGTSCSGSDNVGDTQNQGGANYGCPNFPDVSCSNGPNGDMFMNYMDYTDDACMYMFTAGQKTRSLSLFQPGGSRYSLLSSQGCQAVTPYPNAAFTANNTTSCTGAIQFTDQSSGNPTTWLWNFGDGTTSTLQSPSHTYNTNGIFTVSLIATNSFGADTATQTNYITVTKPGAPALTGGTRCNPGSVTLTANTTDSLQWFATDTGTVLLGTGNPFSTPSISTTTTFYAQALVSGPTYNAGPANNLFNPNGTYLTSAWYLVFNVLKPCTLQSVYAYAQSGGNRTIQLLNSSGAVLATQTVNLSTGGNRITLNFALTPGTGYRLGCPSGTTISLYRNGDGATYPYNDAGGHVSITGNTASGAANYYYYFYDWIIKAPDCISERVPVTATIGAGVSLSAVNATPATCNGLNNGTATVAATGGTPTYTYLWSNGQTTATATNLAANTYTVTVTDAQNCSATASGVVTQPSALTVATSVTASGCGQADGSAQAAAQGGTSPYTYVWNGGSTAALLNNVGAGTYRVTATDNNNCTASAIAVVNNSGPLSANATAANVNCFGENNGEATANVTAGTAPYTYNWSDGQQTATATGLVADSYFVTVTDANGCSAILSTTVTQPAQLQVSTTSTFAACGANNGTATAVVNGGGGNYTYLWSDNQTGATATTLAAGGYTVTVTDAANCTATGTAQVINAGNLSTTFTVSNVLCAGFPTGTATITPTSGTAPYTYVWSTGNTTATATGLYQGTYIVTTTDNNQCQQVDTITVTEPTALQAQATGTDEACSNNNSGTAQVTAAGGTAGYTYLWSNNSTTAAIGNLPTGNYTVTVTDANNCTATAAYTVGSLPVMQLTGTSQGPTCPGEANGYVTVSVSGGSPGYNYNWSNGASTDSIGNLAGGNFTVTVTDDNNCTATALVVLAQPADIQFASATVNATDGQSNGSLTLQNITGGTAPYTIEWSNGDTDAEAEGLAAGVYGVTVTDANGCEKNAFLVVSNITGLANEGNLLHIGLYPNPANGFVNVALSNLSTETALTVTDLLGRQLVQQKVVEQLTRLNTIEWAAGVYAVKIATAQGETTRQLVITR